jgi:hypothetical protein
MLLVRRDGVVTHELMRCSNGGSDNSVGKKFCEIAGPRGGQ